MSFLKKKVSVFVIISILSVQMISVANSCLQDNSIFKTRNKIIFGVSASIIACIIGKKMYGYYYDYLWSHTQAIEYCCKIYKDIYSLDKNLFIDFHQSLLQSDDSALIQVISATFNTKKYPLIACHRQVINSISALTTCSELIKSELHRIQKRKTQLKCDSVSPKNIYLLKTFIELEVQGNQIIAHILDIIAQKTALKKRISLLKEYQNNRIQWLHDYHKKRKRNKYIKNRKRSFSRRKLKVEKDNSYQGLIELMHAAWDN